MSVCVVLCVFECGWCCMLSGLLYVVCAVVRCVLGVGVGGVCEVGASCVTVCG